LIFFRKKKNAWIEIEEFFFAKPVRKNSFAFALLRFYFYYCCRFWPCVSTWRKDSRII